MSNVSSIETGRVMDERTVKINRIKLIAIFGVAVVPVILAFTMYFGGVAIPDSKTNKGNLIWPPITTESLDAGNALANQVSVTESITNTKKWTLMVTGSGQCEQSCKDLIHTVRQVNVSMAKEMDRVTRMLVSSLDASALASIEAEYPQLVTHQVGAETVVKFQSAAVENGALETTGPSDTWMVWVVDPIGNVILQYTSENDGYDMIADLKRLLKLSNIG